MTPTSQQQSSQMQQSHWCHYWFFFAAYTKKVTHNVLGGQTTPKNCSFPLGISIPSNTWFLGHTESYIQMASWAIHQLLQGSQTWPTDRHTYRPRYSICIYTPHLDIAVMLPKNYFLSRHPRNQNLMHAIICLLSTLLLMINLLARKSVNQKWRLSRCTIKNHNKINTISQWYSMQYLTENKNCIDLHVNLSKMCSLQSLLCLKTHRSRS